MKMREFPFRSLPTFAGLSIYEGKKEIACGFIGEVLKSLPVEYADKEIESTNWYFDVFVIRLKGTER